MYLSLFVISAADLNTPVALSRSAPFGISRERLQQGNGQSLGDIKIHLFSTELQCYYTVAHEKSTNIPL